MCKIIQKQWIRATRSEWEFGIVRKRTLASPDCVGGGGESTPSATTSGARPLQSLIVRTSLYYHCRFPYHDVMRTRLEVRGMKAFWRRARGLLGGVVFAVLMGSSTSMAQSGAAPKADGAASADARPTPPPGVDVLSKSQPTAVSGIEVVAKPRATPVEGLVVKATRTCPPPATPPEAYALRPKLVSSYPAEGETVQPGYAVLRLTFDAPMACRGSLPQNLLAACYPDDKEIWHESTDKRSLLILCNFKPNARYKVSINVRIPEHFTGVNGQEPAGGMLSFATSGAAPVMTQPDLIGRDAQLAALLNAVGPPKPALAGNAAEVDALVDELPTATEVSSLRVQAATTCLQARDPPDRDIPPPKVVSSFPAQDQAVQPGLLELRFTFDLPMACTGGVLVRGGKTDPCTEFTPEKVPIAQHWRHGWDRRTLRLLCRVEPGARYTVTLNKTVINATVAWPDFKGLGGGKAQPFELTFVTSNAAPIQTEEDAEVEDPQMAALIEGRRTGREQ